MHRFHIPVMGIGFTIDSALRVAKFGIATVISLADDRLIERVKELHEEGFRFAFDDCAAHPDKLPLYPLISYIKIDCQRTA